VVINVVYVEYGTSYDEACNSRYVEADGQDESHAKAKGADVLLGREHATVPSTIRYIFRHIELTSLPQILY
jgi:hypothetical protein